MPCALFAYYYKKLRIDKKIKKELRVEVQSCGKVILTDGITWMFWVWGNDIKLKESLELVGDGEQKKWQDLIRKIKEFLPVTKETKTDSN